MAIMLPKNFNLWSHLFSSSHGRNASWIASVTSLLNPSIPPSSADSLQNPPPRNALNLKNRYIPLSRSSVFRELIQDGTVVLPSERRDFERLATAIQRRLNAQFNLLERELHVLFQPVVSCEHTTELNQLVHPTPSQNEAGALRRLLSVEKRDREFWILRRLCQLAKFAGFIDVPQKELENAFRSKRLNRESASSFIDPRDYEVVRFWFRGIHPRAMKNLPNTAPSPHKVHSRSGLLHRLGNVISNPRLELASMFSELRRGRWLKRISSATDRTMKLSDAPSPRDFQFTNVLMAVRTVRDQELLLRFYDAVPAARPSRRTNFTDSLSLLLPIIHFHPLTALGRTWIALSCLTAVTCLGVITPMAWLLTSNPEPVFAWSVAASATAGVTASIVWAQYWRSRANANAYLKQLQFDSIRNSGFQSVQSLLRTAIDEEFKALILTYALLLRPTEAKSPLNPVALGVRAETWISKRLSPKQPVAIPVDMGQKEPFGGGSGPLFDVEFDPTRSLALLRRLGLVHGTTDNPQVISVSAAANLFKDVEPGDPSRDLGSLWILDPVFGDEFRTHLGD